MKKYFFLATIVGLWACTTRSTVNVTDSNLAEEETEVTKVITVKENTYIRTSPQRGFNALRANLFEWEGIIDGKYSIFLNFGWDETGHYERSNLRASIKLEGKYSYKKEGKEIALKGEWNRSTNQIQLKVYKDSILDEEFEGQFVSSFQPVVGNWTKVKTNKVLPFELQPVVDYETTQVLAKRLEEALSGGGVEELYAESVGVDEFGIYIDGLEAWNPHWVLSNSFFDGSTSYNSDMRASDYELSLTIKTLPTSKEILIWENESSAGFTKGYYDEDDVYQEPEESPDSDFHNDTTYLLWYNKDTFINILEETGRDYQAELVEDGYIIKQKTTQKSWKLSEEKKTAEIIK